MNYYNLKFLSKLSLFIVLVFFYLFLFIQPSLAGDLEVCQDAGYTEVGNCNGGYCISVSGNNMECAGCIANPKTHVCCLKPQEPTNPPNPIQTMITGCIDYTLGNTLYGTTSTPNDPPKESKPVIFTPQVSIPGSIQFGGKIFSINQGQDIQVNGELLAKYIAVLFNWLIGAIGVIVVAYMAFGGMQWLAAAGSADGINKAKETIRDSMIGLLLVVSSYTVLYFINPNLVGFKILDIPIVSPIYLNFDEGDISVGKGVQRDAGGYSSVEGLICYKQAWEPWGGKLYGDCEPSNGKDSNYANAACGPTSVAMVVSSLTSQSVEPNIIGQKMISGGYRPCGGGTSLDGIMKVPLQYGLKTSSVNWNGVTQCLQNGGYVVARMWGPAKGKPQVCSRFTNNGHYIVIGGINGNKIQINDSAGSYPRKNTDYKGTEGGINGCYREDNIDDVKSCGVDYVCISK